MALKWTALALSLCWLAAALAVAGRRSIPVAWLLAASVTPLLLREPRLLFATWNPFTPVLPLLLAIVAAADSGAGRWWSLPVVVVATSFAIQSHVGLVVVCLALVIGVAANALLNSRTRLPSESPTRTAALLTTVIVAVLLWAVPIIHELRVSPGNLASILWFFTEPHPHPTWERAGVVAAYELGGPITPSWRTVTGEVPRHVFLWIQRWVVCQPLLLVVAALVAHRRNDAFGRALALTSLAATLAVPVAVHGITGPVFEYLVLWAAVISAVNIAVLLATLVAPIPVPHAIVRYRSLWLLLFLACWGVIGGYRLVGKHRSEAIDTTVRALTVDLQDYCDRHGVRRPLLAFDADAWHEGLGIVLQFYKADRDIAVRDDAAFIVGTPFARSGREDAAFLVMPASRPTIPDSPAPMEWITTRGGWRIVRTGI
jgi:hypothetical protein